MINKNILFWAVTIIAETSLPNTALAITYATWSKRIPIAYDSQYVNSYNSDAYVTASYDVAQYKSSADQKLSPDAQIVATEQTRDQQGYSPLNFDYHCPGDSFLVGVQSIAQDPLAWVPLDKNMLTTSGNTKSVRPDRRWRFLCQFFEDSTGALVHKNPVAAATTPDILNISNETITAGTCTWAKTVTPGTGCNGSGTFTEGLKSTYMIQACTRSYTGGCATANDSGGKGYSVVEPCQQFTDVNPDGLGFNLKCGTDGLIKEISVKATKNQKTDAVGHWIQGITPVFSFKCCKIATP